MNIQRKTVDLFVFDPTRFIVGCEDSGATCTWHKYPGNAILSRNAYVIQSSAGDPGEVSLSSEDNPIEPFSFEKGSSDIQFAFELSNPALRTIVRVALWISR